jgi:hypothetical protein
MEGDPVGSTGEGGLFLSALDAASQSALSHG